MALETQYTANTGMATITTANTSLTGSGTLNTDIWIVLTAAANGTLIKTVTVKAQGNTSGGMIRLFACDASNNRIIAEAAVPAVTKSSHVPAFEVTLNTDYFLESGGTLKATTEKTETFNVIAEGLDFAYYGPARPESSKYTANTGMSTLTTGNSSLTGSGTLDKDIWDILTAASNGTVIQSIIIKAQVNTTPGMVRLFINDGANTKLLTEVPVPAVTKSSTDHSFSYRVDFGGRDFALKAGWKLYATTEKSESFNLIAEGLDWVYPA
jgi:hypothetical protein